VLFDHQSIFESRLHGNDSPRARLLISNFTDYYVAVTIAVCAE
jgi:hypothetical protein